MSQNQRNRILQATFLPLMIGLITVIGCSKKSEPKKPLVPLEQKSTPINITDQPASEQAAPPAAGTTPVPAEAAAVTPPPFKFTESDALTLLVNQFRAEQGRFPSDVSEIVKVGMTLKLPAPPAGKQFVIVKVDDKTARVEIR